MATDAPGVSRMSGEALQCPQCGAALRMETAAAVMVVCGHCRSTITRDAEGARRIGAMAELVEDGSPVRLGTVGASGRRGFRVVGRLRLRYEDGEWNEWFIAFDDGRTGWLSDASAQYAVTEALADAAALAHVPPFERLRPGDPVKVAGSPYTVSDVRTAHCVGGEGELPVVVGAGWEARVADARRGASFVTLDYSDGAPVAYAGVAGDLALDASTLRSRDEVQAAAGRYRGDVVPFACPQCGGAVSVVAAMATHVVCPYCGSAVDCSGPRAEILAAAHRASEFKPTLPLGAAGTLDGVRYTVIGAMRCRVPDDPAEPAWTEYLLFSERAAYLWLVETVEGWQRVEVCDVWPTEVDATACRWRERPWRRRYAYASRVDEVFGAFNWRVRRGDVVQVADYANGAQTLTRECSDAEVTWAWARPVAFATVRRAFGLEAIVPSHATRSATRRPRAETADDSEENDLTTPAVLASVAVFVLSSLLTPVALFIALALIWGPVALARRADD